MSFSELSPKRESKNEKIFPKLLIPRINNNSPEISGVNTTIGESQFEENNFVYSTPMIKRTDYLPTTPRKEINHSKFENIKVKGRNLTALFDSM